MNSFTLTAVGNLARNPEIVADSQPSYARFLLVGNDYAGKDEEGTPHQVVTSIWFIAFGPIGEAIAHHVRKGDQLIIEARVRSNIRCDGKGTAQHDYAFVVQDFKYGARGKASRTESEAAHSSADA